MQKIKSLFSSLLYFLFGVFMTLVIFASVFLIGRGIYSAVQLYMEKANLVKVSGEVISIEEYLPVSFLEDKNYKVTFAYEYGTEVYDYTRDLKKAPNQTVGDTVTLHIDLVNPLVIKERSEEYISEGIVTILIVLSVIILWRSNSKSSYLRIYPMNPQKIIYCIRRKNQKENRWIIRGIMLLILAGEIIGLSESGRVGHLFWIVLFLLLVSIWMLCARISKIRKLDNEEFDLVYDCCAEKRTEDYGDSLVHYLMLEETGKVFSVSEKAYYDVETGDEVCLMYWGSSDKKPYMLCIEKR